jgi:hypothetical protein
MTSPNEILVMRHAEKTGDLNDKELSAAGKVRAETLAGYIPERFGKPDFLFATMESKHSLRPIRTITPLSARIGVPIDATSADQDYGALALHLLSDALFDRKRVLVCWHHGNIPSLVRALGAEDGSFPDPWSPAVFNLVLRLTLSTPGRVAVEQVTEPF